MSEEHIRLIAKIQHFYEMMMNINSKLLDGAIAGHPSHTMHITDTVQIINSFIDEYEKAFQSFLYKESNENK